jgi:hypothetical protein
VSGRERVERAWRAVAERVGGTFSGPSGQSVVQRREGDWILTLDRVSNGTQVVTRLRAPFHNPRGVRLRLRREGVMDDLWKKLGLVTEVDSDDAGFDRRFLVRGTPRDVVRDLLSRDRIRALLDAQPRIDIRILKYTLEVPFPPQIHQLHFMDGRRKLPTVERLVGLFELFLEMLPVLAPAGHGYEDQRDRLLERLRSPAGSVRTFTSVLLWDGDSARRDAAERLGAFADEVVVDALIAALDDDDDELVAATAGALGDIGDPRAVPGLFELLGERRRKGRSGTLAADAADALRRMDRGAEVDAFAAALAGDASHLAATRGDDRRALVRALMTVLDSAEFGARSHAARALGALGAGEALPLLRSKLATLGMRTTLTRAASAAITEIEQRASLPRPARDPAPAADTLPRPADEDAGGGRERLPRPASGKRDEGGGQGGEGEEPVR